MLGGRRPVCVDRLHVVGVGLAAPSDQEALWDRAGLVDLRLRNRRAADAACRLRDERQRHYGGAGEIGASLLVGDVDQLLEAPFRGEHRERGLHVYSRVSGAYRQRPGLGRRQAGQERAVHKQAPDLLERHIPDEILDVDAPVAERAALLVGLGDLGRERDYALEAGADLLFGGGCHGAQISC